MNTTQIAAYADYDRLAGTGDSMLKLQAILRRKIIPEFYNRVGACWWRRLQVRGLLLEEGKAEVDMGAAMAIIRSVYVSGVPATYIGDDEAELEKAEAFVTTGEQIRPGKYWTQFSGYNLYNVSMEPDINDPEAEKREGPVTSRLLKFNGASDGNYEVSVVGFIQLWFDDDVTEVDLNPSIPFEFQWALVEGLKREIYEARVGTQDARYKLAHAEFEKWIAMASKPFGKVIDSTPRRG